MSPTFNYQVSYNTYNWLMHGLVLWLPFTLISPALSGEQCTHMHGLCNVIVYTGEVTKTPASMAAIAKTAT